MSENLSSSAIIHAILALNNESIIQRDYLDSGEVPADEIEMEEDTLNDLEQALMEFIDLYKEKRKQEPELPTIEELFGEEE
jgi:hypothetical protein